MRYPSGSDAARQRRARHGFPRVCDGARSNAANRNALRYMIQNTTLPQRVRAQAQLQLASMHAYTRSTQIKGRCIMGGKGRGVFRDFRMARVSGATAVKRVKI